MNGVFFPNDPAGAFQAIHMPEFGISWAGANPFGEGFCFGSEAGTLVLTDTMGRPRSFLGQASASGEAINGVAYSQNWLAVTTRKDINLIAPLLFHSRHSQEAVVISGGAPDVIVAPSGHFVVPLGPSGIMFVKPGMKEDDPVTVSNSSKLGMNFCRVAALKGENENDLIVCAGRRGGIGFTDFREGIRGHILQTVVFDELDIVDVCSMGTAEHPLAVAATGRDGSLVLFRDIRTDKKPLTLKLKSVTGTVYRILSAGGDIYLLTSNGLFALFQLADRFRQGLSLGELTTHVLRIPIEAADANLVDQRWLLAAGIDDVFRFDVHKMPKPPEGSTKPEDARQAENTDVDGSWGAPTLPEQVEVEPHWEQSDFEQNLEHMASVV
jgi:hypothetical protein